MSTHFLRCRFFADTVPHFFSNSFIFLAEAAHVCYNDINPQFM